MNKKILTVMSILDLLCIGTAILSNYPTSAKVTIIIWIINSFIWTLIATLDRNE